MAVPENGRLQVLIAKPLGQKLPEPDILLYVTNAMCNFDGIYRCPDGQWRKFLPDNGP